MVGGSVWGSICGAYLRFTGASISSAYKTGFSKGELYL